MPLPSFALRPTISGKKNLIPVGSGPAFPGPDSRYAIASAAIGSTSTHAWVRELSITFSSTRIIW